MKQTFVLGASARLRRADRAFRSNLLCRFRSTKVFPLLSPPDNTGEILSLSLR
jgi:hypothetical protein